MREILNASSRDVRSSLALTHKKWGLMAFLILIAIALPIGVSQVTEISLNIPSGYVANHTITGSVTITLESLIANGSVLDVYIGDSLEASRGLSQELEGLEYSYALIPFNYTITASGNTASYPEQDFSWTITASGTKTTGGSWEVPQIGSDQVSGLDGLKYITTSSITPPSDNNNDTIWSVSQNNTDVDAEMMMACGGESYGGFTVSSSGWVINRTLGLLGTCPDNNCHANEAYMNCWCGIPGSSDWETQIEPFDDGSLSNERGRFSSEPIGGIYKNGVYQLSPGQAEWDGSSGYIKVHSFDLNSRYTISYFPPNGNRFCAYTDTTEAQPWLNTTMVEGASLMYLDSYGINYTQSELAVLFGIPGNLLESSLSYSVSTEPGGLIASITQNPDGVYTVAVYTDSPEFSSRLNISVSLDSMNISAPDTGDYNMTVYVKRGTDVYNSGTQGFAACPDNDSDGYAPEGSACSPADCNDNDPGIHPGAYDIPNNGIDENCDDIDGITDIDQDGYNNTYLNGTVWDCDDSDPTVHPRVVELCNGKDDNCDGVVDNVRGGNSTETTECGCYGGNPPVTETCNRVDDDCDGIVDSMVLPCNLTRIGICGVGNQTCTDGSWSECPQAVTEVCDYSDNDCNGVVDDGVKNTCTIYSTCETEETCEPCPVAPRELCNGLDDNCDGRIDEVFECISGETKVYGSNIGICEPGTITCSDCEWSPCEGCVEAKEEVCGNGLDDDCNGDTDEAGCIIEVKTPCGQGLISANCLCGGSTYSWGYCCNDAWGMDSCGGFDFGDIGIWLIVGGAVILVGLGILILQFRHRGKKLSWEELYSRWK